MSADSLLRVNDVSQDALTGWAMSLWKPLVVSFPQGRSARGSEPDSVRFRELTPEEQTKVDKATLEEKEHIPFPYLAGDKNL